jgi:hypothetical protein
VLACHDINVIRGSETEFTKTCNMKMKCAVVWHVTPCSLVEKYQRYLVQSTSRRVVLMVDASRSFDLLVLIDQNI